MAEAVVDAPKLETLAANFAGKTRREFRQGREYLVAPVTLIVPGVLNGSAGPLLYLPEDLGQNPASWNGMPLTPDHPTLNGKPVSARDPRIMDQWLGFVMNTTFKGKLQAEAWFDVIATNAFNAGIIPALEDGQPLEVSTGLFPDYEPAKPGAVWNGTEPYSYITRNHRPDHLAILTDKIGACSVKKGCGVNNSDPGWIDKVVNAFKSALTSVPKDPVSNSQPNAEHQKESEEVMNQDQRKAVIDGLITNCECWQEGDREALNKFSDDQLDRLKKQTEKAAEVQATLNARQKEEADKAAAQKKADDEKKAAELAANSQKDPKPKTEEEWLKDAPESVRNTLSYARQIEEEQRQKIIGTIVANVAEDKRDAKREYLATKSLTELRELEDLMPAPAQPETRSRIPNYAGAAGPTGNTERKKRTPMETPVINWKEKVDA